MQSRRQLIAMVLGHRKKRPTLLQSHRFRPRPKRRRAHSLAAAVWMGIALSSLSPGAARVAVGAETGSDPETSREEFDPWAGMERDGRIPAAEGA